MQICEKIRDTQFNYNHKQTVARSLANSAHGFGFIHMNVSLETIIISGMSDTDNLVIIEYCYAIQALHRQIYDYYLSRTSATCAIDWME